jgi:hypothetical protein
MRHEDQPMPRPIPRIQNNVENTEYSYRWAQLKAKSSCSLRKKSHKATNKNAFFTTDRNFKNIRQTLWEDRYA